MVQSVVNHKGGISFQSPSPFIQQSNNSLSGHVLSPLHLACMFLAQSSGLPPVADTSAFSLARAQPRKHLQGQLLSDTFSPSDGLAESSLLGSSPPDGGREAQERLGLSPGHGGALMT